jgi:hypothetical protein
MFIGNVIVKGKRFVQHQNDSTITDTGSASKRTLSLDERDAILKAIEILDVKKREVVSKNLDAWYVLYRAKSCLMGQLYGLWKF